MFANEDELKKYIRELPFEDTPRELHKQQLQQLLLDKLAQSDLQPEPDQPDQPDHQSGQAGTLSVSGKEYRRRIMKSRITKISAAAAILLVVFAVYFQFRHSGRQETLSAFTLLARASAAERTLFASDKVVYLLNKIIVYPVPKELPTSSKLDQMHLSGEQREYIETSNSWLDYNWLPLCSLDADGQFRFHQLKLAKDLERQYVVTDQAWYDPLTGCFARVLELDQQVIFANSFDGENIHTLEAVDDGRLEPMSQAITAAFHRPENPAEFLGLSAGLQNSFGEGEGQNVQEISESRLEDGTPVTIYKFGYEDLLGDVNTYWLFKVRADGTTAEMEFVMSGATQLVIRRVLTQSVEKPALSWNLSEIEENGKQGGNNQVSVNPDMVIPNVSVEHMIERAGFETYLFSSNPAWTGDRVIVDCLDLPSPPSRMFFVIHHASDGRDMVLVQAETYNKMMGRFFQQGRLVYRSPNGFKVWAGGPEKWWTKIVLTSAQLVPAEDRSGYGLESPVGTFPSLAINGQLTEEELHTLVDSLIPAKEYVKEN